jgi:hypothetical protein
VGRFVSLQFYKVILESMVVARKLQNYHLIWEALLSSKLNSRAKEALKLRERIKITLADSFVILALFH